MALGGAIGAMAILLKVEFLLLLVGGIFVIEALSVMLQVFSFKYWGRRVFLMAPIHHHFEMKAWSETKIMVRFWIVTGILCAAGFALFYKYYPQIRPPLVKSARLRPRAVGSSAAAERLERARRRGRSGRPLARQRGRPRRCSTASSCVVKSPGVPGERAARAPRRASAASRSGPRSSSASGCCRERAVRRRHRHERQDDDDRAARRDLPRGGRDVAVAGQRRHAAHVRRAADWVVCELSSFQLEDVARRSPATSRCCSTSSPTTSTGTASFEAYRDAKLRIFERARVAVVPRGLGLDGIEFSADDPLPAEPLIRGAHNRENAAAATAAARAAGIDDDAIAEALRTFPGVPHRLEPVGEVGGVRFVNDSKATNVAAARRASLPTPTSRVHLILGGSLKGEDFAPLAAAIGPNVRSVHLSARPRASSEAIGGRRTTTARSPCAVAHAAARRSRATSCCSAPRARATTSSTNFERAASAFRRLVAALVPDTAR